MLMMMLAVVLLGTAPSDDPHEALLRVLAHGDYAGACSQAALHAAAAQADVRVIGHLDGSRVVLANPQDPCMCGNVNCPWYALRLDDAGPRVLLETIAYEVHPFGAAAPLPRLREFAHDSALSRNETIDAYRGDRYVATSTVRVRNGDDARKPVEIPVRLSARTRSRVLSGKVSLGWGDLYTFAAKRGQRVMVTNVRSRVPLSFTVFLPKLSDSFPLSAGSAFAVPRNGTYALQVDNGSGTDVPYAVTLSVR